MKLVNTLNTLVDKILQNKVCWSCGLSHKDSDLVCLSCEQSIEKVEMPCIQCGLAHQLNTDICVHCLSKPKLWQQMVAPLSYQPPISHLIQQLKFNHQLGVLSALMQLVEPYFKHLTKMPDVLVPVPLYTTRYTERGFNQSLEIAKFLNQLTGIPIRDDLVERVIDTPRQSELKLKQREKNIKNAFVVDEQLAVYKHVAIVDDVITSGSTVHELTKQCLAKGVGKVDVWAIARVEL